MSKKMTFGLIVGNRGFFPDHLAKSGREEMIRVLEAAGYGVIALTPDQSKYGAVETRAEARACGYDAPVTEAALGSFEKASKTGLGAKDCTTLPVSWVNSVRRT